MDFLTKNTLKDDYPDFKRMMEDVPVCKRVHGAIRRVR